MTVLNAQCLLAYEMNIEFVASEKQVGKGHDGKNEDDEYFDLEPDF